MMVGAFALCGALALISKLSSLPAMALLLLGPGAIGFMLIGPLNTSTMAARWFWRRRGLAMGLAAVATSGGGLVVVPLLARAIQQEGWRTALFQEACLIAGIVTGLAFAVMRDKPGDLGLDNHPENVGRAPAVGPRPHWSEILRRRAFWIPGLALAVISSTCQVVVTTLVPYGVGMGLTPLQAALSISVFALCAAIAKVVAGVLADYLPARSLIITALVLMVASQVGLWLASNQIELVAGASLAGVALGMALPSAGIMIAADFSSASFGTAMGWIYGIAFLLAILGTRFIGFVYDTTHSYTTGFATFTSATLVAFLTTAFLEFYDRRMAV